MSAEQQIGVKNGRDFDIEKFLEWACETWSLDVGEDGNLRDREKDVKSPTITISRTKFSDKFRAVMEEKGWGHLVVKQGEPIPFTREQIEELKGGRMDIGVLDTEFFWDNSIPEKFLPNQNGELNYTQGDLNTALDTRQIKTNAYIFLSDLLKRCSILEYLKGILDDAIEYDGSIPEKFLPNQNGELNYTQGDLNTALIDGEIDGLNYNFLSNLLNQYSLEPTVANRFRLYIQSIIQGNEVDKYGKRMKPEPKIFIEMNRLGLRHHVFGGKANTIDLTAEQLPEVNLNGAIAYKVIMDDVQVNGEVAMQDAKIREVSQIRAQIQRVNQRGAEIVRVYQGGAKISEVDQREARILAMDQRDSEIARVDQSEARIGLVHQARATIPKLDQKNAKIFELYQMFAKVDEIDQSAADIETYQLSSAEIKRLKQKGVEINHISFNGATIESIQQDAALIDYADFRGATIELLEQDHCYVGEIDWEGAKIGELRRESPMKSSTEARGRVSVGKVTGETWDTICDDKQNGITDQPPAEEEPGFFSRFWRRIKRQFTRKG